MASKKLTQQQKMVVELRETCGRDDTYTFAIEPQRVKVVNAFTQKLEKYTIEAIQAVVNGSMGIISQVRCYAYSKEGALLAVKTHEYDIGSGKLLTIKHFPEVVLGHKIVLPLRGMRKHPFQIRVDDEGIWERFLRATLLSPHYEDTVRKLRDQRRKRGRQNLALDFEGARYDNVQYGLPPAKSTTRRDPIDMISSIAKKERCTKPRKPQEGPTDDIEINPGNSSSGSTPVTPEIPEIPATNTAPSYKGLPKPENKPLVLPAPIQHSTPGPPPPPLAASCPIVRDPVYADYSAEQVELPPAAPRPQPPQGLSLRERLIINAEPVEQVVDTESPLPSPVGNSSNDPVVETGSDPSESRRRCIAQTTENNMIAFPLIPVLITLIVMFLFLFKRVYSPETGSTDNDEHHKDDAPNNIV